MASEEKFDPMGSPVDQFHIPHLWDITYRARQILSKRTSPEVRSAQETVDDWIAEFFETTFQEEVARLRSQAEAGNERALEFFRVRRYRQDDHWEHDYIEIESFNDQYRDDLDIPNEFNTTESKALDSCIDWFDTSETGFGEDSEPIFFAALALKLVEKALWYLDQSTNLDANRWEEIEAEAKKALGLASDENLPKYDQSIVDRKLAYEAAMDALEAVTFADKYSHVNWMKKDFAKRMAKVLSASEKKHQEQQEAEVLRVKRERTKTLNQQREAKRKEAEALVLADWESNVSRFPSAEDAGEHYSSWLKSVPGKRPAYRPSTCATWIRNRAKELGIRWR
ncbi:hypothetical protein LGN09_24030 [Burkholderia cenocepacia]|uniref:hypothetical protein n=1 Tax=Burkholderia cenocepacia TaxID=95486 RepID=UPI001CF24459|nr:hypothetical protein [Burkholderia cenocepacia]MCA8407980.1 hypothetical protein [Burkholderia cenocepacia]